MQWIAITISNLSRKFQIDRRNTREVMADGRTESKTGRVNLKQKRPLNFHSLRFFFQGTDLVCGRFKCMQWIAITISNLS